MKTKLYLFLTFILLTLTVSAQQYNTLLMENWVNNAWENASRSTNTYDANGNILTTTMEEWADGAWQNSAIMTNTLNEDGTVKETMTKAWDNGSWQDAMKIVYTYNNAKKVLTAITQMGSEGTWIDFSKIIYTYNEQNQLVTQVTQIINILTMEMVNVDQNTYSYNADGTENQVVTQTWNTNNEWENSGRFTNTYDNSKQVTLELNEKWENNAWVNDTKTDNTYNAELVQESIGQKWLDNAWVNTFKDIYTYNGNKDMTEVLTQEWIASLSQWQNDSRLTYTYGTTGIHPVDFTDLSLGVFPNPFTDQITIQSGLKGMHGIEVYNTSGLLIYSVKTNENSYKLNLGALKNGIYLIKTPQNNQSIKVLKSK